MEDQAKRTMAAIEGVGVAQDVQTRRGATASRAMQGQTSEMKDSEKAARATRQEIARLGTENQKSAGRIGVMQKALRSLRSELGQLRGAGAGGVNVSGMQGFQRDMKTAQKAIGDFMGAFGSLVSSLTAFKLPAYGIGFGLLAQSVTALGGSLAGLLPLVQAVGTGFLALPGAVGVAAQGLFSLKAAFSGVMQAVSAGMQAQNEYGLNQRQFQQQVTSATDAIISAHQGLTNAIYDQQQAQLQLTIARRDATRQLQDMEFQARSAVLQEAHAGLNIAQAKQELQQAMMTPGTTQLQLQQLRLGVLDAQQASQQTRVQASRARQDYARARRGDPTSQPVMAVAQAHHAQGQAVIGVANAERSLTRAQMSLNLLTSQGNSGVAAYKRSLQALQPIQRQFVRFLLGPIGGHGGKSLMAEFQGLQEAAGEGLFPPLERGIRTLQGGMGMLGNAFRSTGRVIGNFGAGVINVFFGPRGIGKTQSILNGNVTIMQHLSGAGVAVVGMFQDLMVAAGPTLIWASRLVEKWAQMHRQMMETAAGSRSLEERFGKLRILIRETLDIFHQLHLLFHGITEAAWGLNQTLMHGAEGGLKKWADWANSTQGQERMKRWFKDLLPILRALGTVVKAIARELVTMTSGKNATGAAGLISGLANIVQPLGQMILNLQHALGPSMVSGLVDVVHLAEVLAGKGGPFAIWLEIMDKIVNAFRWLVQHVPGVGAVLAGLFAANVIAGFVTKMSGAVLAVDRLKRAWLGVGRAQRGGMNSPGVGGRGFFGRLFGRGGGGGAGGVLTAGLEASRSWGIRSADGPGSAANPLAVIAMGDNFAPGGGLGGSPLGGATKNAEKAGTDISKVAGGASELSRLERVGAAATSVPLLGRFASKLPGALGRGATLAEGGEVLGGAGKLAGLAGGFGKFLGPVGLGLMALPGIMALFGTKGGIGTKLGAAANATVSSLTFGLVNPHFGAPTAAHQRAQGTGRADVSFGGFAMDPTTGLLSKQGTQQYKNRLATLQQQYHTAQGHTVTNYGMYGMKTGQYVTGKDTAVMQDRLAQIRRLEADFNREQWAAGKGASDNWTQAFQQGVNSGKSPKTAMTQMISGLGLQMQQLNPMGRRSMQNNLAAWGAQVVASNPKMKKPVQQLNDWIVGQFQTMGVNVQIVNGQILDGSAKQWTQIGTAVTDPVQKAMLKTSGMWGVMKKQAIGDMQAMGFTKADAEKIFQEMQSGQVSTADVLSGKSALNTLKKSGVKNASSIVSGALNVSTTHASGGRIGGNNLRDVYQFGNSMFGGGELVMNRHQELDANARLMRHGEPTVGSIVANRKTPHWAFANGGRTRNYAYGGYIDPITGFTLSRTDMGVDANAAPGTPIRAFGTSRMTSLTPNWYAGQPEMTFQLLGGPDRGRYWYVAEQIVPNAKTGQIIPQGGIVARYAPSGTGIEIGWASNASGQTLAQGTTGYSEGQVTKAGASFKRLIEGADPGIGGMGGMGGMAIKPIRPPKMGLPGVPGVVAQTAANTVASVMTQQVNAALGAQSGGMNFAGVAGRGGSSAANEALGRRMMLAAGWGAGQWPYLQALWTQESNWSSTAVNPSSGAYGIPQSLGHGHPYNLGDARAQIAWGLNYIKGTYGSPAGAEAHEKAFNWYSGGGRLNWGGWHGDGGSFTTRGPTIFGAGERPGQRETVTITPEGAAGKPINIHIERIEVNRRGDVKKIVDEELSLLADSLRSRH